MNTQTHTFKITGIGPMLMHCGQTADPLNQFAKALAKANAKRNKTKTEEDHAACGMLEWWAGLYTDRPLHLDSAGNVEAEEGTRLVLPAHVLDSCIREGARKNKAGKQASAGVIVEGPAKFNGGTGPDLNKTAMDERFHYRCAVKVGASRVMRTRPIFNEWSAEFSVCLDPSVIDIETVSSALEAAGRLVGIGDWRPGAPRGGSFGRFTVGK